MWPLHFLWRLIALFIPEHRQIQLENRLWGPTRIGRPVARFFRLSRARSERTLRLSIAKAEWHARHDANAFVDHFRAIPGASPLMAFEVHSFIGCDKLRPDSPIEDGSLHNVILSDEFDDCAAKYDFNFNADIDADLKTAHDLVMYMSHMYKHRYPSQWKIRKIGLRNYHLKSIEC